ncbi:uncharacterized protein LOC119547251 [Drosophila subpulchrella]|uniref:uncharacterized protein LOC119547251 n=1 Tax=Drosophila subpulchrella TaxID=1486046 RepID=UPI0018A1514F|nr:uncharacterized protein LOC119547251 [Drosophila subpulchrella]
MKIDKRSFIFITIWLVHVFSLKEPICGSKPKIKRCILPANTPITFYYYNATTNACHTLKKPCEKLVRKFATKAICKKTCQN